MINTVAFLRCLNEKGIDFFTGVPDSLLKSFGSLLMDTLPPTQHIISANEGSAIGLAIGHHLATGNIPMIYMQNSGFGNIVNPVLSLADKGVYSIPMVLLIGWRGRPGIKDEPQHITQGRVMIDMIEAMGLEHFNVGHDDKSAQKAVDSAIAKAEKDQCPVVLIAEKGSFDKYEYSTIEADFPMTREEAIKTAVDTIESNSIIVSTTGMASRELFEHRVSCGTGHEKDFLTVGGMGHANQIALGVSLEKTERKVVCIDGDGAAIMHMGSLTTIGQLKPKNYLHVLINNGAHDSVGGQPTAAFQLDLPGIAMAVGFKSAIKVTSVDELISAIKSYDIGPMLVEVLVRKGNRADLGRPTRTPKENKSDFMSFVAS